MTDDLLKQYTSALRQEYDGATASPEASRARIVRTLAERRPRRAKWWTVGIPLLALLGGSTAWAAASGQLTRIVATASVALGITEETPSEIVATSPAQGTWSKKSAAASSPADDHGLKEEPAIEEAAPAEPQPEEPTAQVLPPPIRRAASEISPHNELIVSREQDEQKKRDEAEALAAYKLGHDAHLGRGDCATAIGAYGSYLSRYPNGSFVLEARYNRAVCLVQVGQLEQAKSALRPFAEGTFGGYRKDQARALIDALSEATGGTDEGPLSP